MYFMNKIYDFNLNGWGSGWRSRQESALLQHTAATSAHDKPIGNGASFAETGSMSGGREQRTKTHQNTRSCMSRII